ncbi:49daf663-8d8e-42e1-be40-1657520a2886 [Sclerotinia trifoliorum]|uniref:49daf663-8d8e-42e1-be40-1657520a2886 n=1 Tax=Sclerotinia trifoliorum TaxID=28548 RepID=A0A8H2VW00_9HELO|nr:49daf663-8d8e-42e1-be40-1657520a2886 [Sclerotinia trifoliorum]
MSKNGYDSSATAIYHGRSRNKESNPISSTSNTSTTRSRHREAISADKKPSKSKPKSARSPGDYDPGYGWRQAPLLVLQNVDTDTELETSDTENEFVKNITGRNRSREYRSSPRSRERNKSKPNINGNNTDASSISKRTIPLYSEGSDPGIRSDRKSRSSSRPSSASRGAKSSRSATGVPDYHSSNFDWNHVPPIGSKLTDNEFTDSSSRARMKKKGSRSFQSDSSSKKSHNSTTTNSSSKSVSSVEQIFQEAVRVKLSRPASNDVRTVPGKRDVVIDRAGAHRAEIEQEVIFDAATDWEGPGAGALKKEHSSSSSSSSQSQNNRYQNPSNTAHKTTTTTTSNYNHSNPSIRKKRIGGPEDPTFMPSRKPVPKPKDLRTHPTLPNLSSRESSRVPSRSNIQPRDRVPSVPEGWENPFDKYGLPEKGKEKDKEKKNRLGNMKMSEKLGRALRGFGRRSREEGGYA